MEDECLGGKTSSDCGEGHVIYGNPPSKPNCYKIIRKGGRMTLAKQAGLIRYERDFMLQCRQRGLLLDGPFGLTVDVFFDSGRQDLDNSLKIILDCLQSANVITNDRHCMQITATKHIDRVSPRIIYYIYEIIDRHQDGKQDDG